MGSIQDHTATCCRLSWMLIPGPIVSRLQVQCDEHWRQLDLGSVACGNSTLFLEELRRNRDWSLVHC